MIRRLHVLLLVLVAVVLSPGVAAADPAGPTNFRSEVRDITPADTGIEVEVLGGDAFVRLTVPPGTEVFVPGYETEEGAAPYLWFAPDGRVLVNERSPARYLNDARYGSRDVAVPASADPAKPPVWVPVADGGSYAWHDHRIHWMSPTLPDQVDADAGTSQRVFDWEIPLAVNGESVTVTGELFWVPSRTPVVPGALALLVAAGGALLVRRDRRSLPAVVGVGALAALVVTGVQHVGLPVGVVGPFPPLLLAVVGLVGALASLGLRRRDETQATIVGLLAALPVAGVAVVQARGMVAPVVPADLPPGIFGALVAVALGAALGALLGGLTTLATPLEPEPAPEPR